MIKLVEHSEVYSGFAIKVYGIHESDVYTADPLYGYTSRIIVNTKQGMIVTNLEASDTPYDAVKSIKDDIEINISDPKNILVTYMEINESKKASALTLIKCSKDEISGEINLSANNVNSTLAICGIGYVRKCDINDENIATNILYTDMRKVEDLLNGREFTAEISAVGRIIEEIYSFSSVSDAITVAKMRIFQYKNGLLPKILNKKNIKVNVRDIIK